MADSPAGQRYERLAGEIDRALGFMRACGADPQELRTVELYSSHEALLLDYEQALTRTDSRDRPALRHLGALPVGRRADQGAGRRARGVRQRPSRNPIGVKVGPGRHPGRAAGPGRQAQPGRRARQADADHPAGRRADPGVLPPLIEAVAAEGMPVAWVCDPMHGNTFEAPSGHKTRRFDDVLDEVQGFFEVHRAARHPPWRHPHRVHRRQRHRVRRRQLRDRRRRPAPALRDRVRPTAEPQPVARPGLHRRRELPPPASWARGRQPRRPPAR